MAALAFVTVYGVARAWRGPDVAHRAVVLLALFPSSLFLWCFYTEGLFIALSAGALWADRRDRHGLTALLLLAVSATRPVGIGVGLVVVLARVLRRRRLDWTSVLYTVAAGAGLAAVMIQQGIEMGDPLSFVSAQKYWHRKLDFPWASVREGLGALWGGDPRAMKALDLVGLVLVGACVAYAILQRRTRWPREAWMLPMVVIGIPLCGPYLSSMNRFVLSAWPVFVIGGEWLGRSRRPVRVAWYAAGAIMSIVAARYWAHGDFIG